MKFHLLIAAVVLVQSLHAQVGIGTTSPSSNAVLDVNSNNKGLMLPRLADTSNVSNPSAGLLIYNMQTHTPTYHDGNRWSALAVQTNMQMNGADSLTYTISGASNGFVNGTYPMVAVSNGISNSGGGGSMLQDISMVKHQDINTIAFTRASVVLPNLTSMVIEIRAYVPGDSDPTYSLKMTNIQVTSYVVSNDGQIIEALSILPVIFGYRDWVNGTSFAWNDLTNTEVAY